MKIHLMPFGPPQTNCYILQSKEGELVIDPGIGATNWVMQNVKNPLAILLTHGHYDHIWSLAELKALLPNTSIYAPKEDAFMLESDCFDTGLSPSKADYLIECKKASFYFRIADFDITYWHFPGHTPGCSMVEVNNVFFSGDFIFYRGIGRYDFPYSNPSDMKESLERFQAMHSDEDKIIYPGHGQKTSLFKEQANASLWRIYT